MYVCRIKNIFVSFYLVFINASENLYSGIQAHIHTHQGPMHRMAGEQANYANQHAAAVPMPQ